MVGADRGKAGNHFAFLFYLQLILEAICPNIYAMYILGSGDSSVIKRRTRDRKVPGSSPGKSGRKIFFFGVNFLR